MTAVDLMAWKDHSMAGVVSSVVGHAEIRKANTEDYYCAQDEGEQGRPLAAASGVVKQRIASRQGRGCDDRIIGGMSCHDDDLLLERELHFNSSNLCGKFVMDRLSVG
jgi:hypothetical protein